MLLRALVAVTLCSASAAAAVADPLAEVRKTFTIGGKPIPPEVFSDFGDAWLADNRPVVVGIDADAAIDSNRYADPIKVTGGWVEQTKPASDLLSAPETMSYEYRGVTANGLMVFVTQFSSGGTGVFTNLDILDAASKRAFDEEGSTYMRLDLTPVRTVVLGDRWEGDVTISGNSIRVVTEATHGGPIVSPLTIEARRP